MRSKKLLTLIIVLAVVVVVVVVLASVFSVRKVLPIYHDFDGSIMTYEAGAPTANDVLKFSKGRSILFLSKDSLIEKLNLDNTQWHTIAVIKNFPNILEVHFVKRVPVVKIDVGSEVYLDCFGYVMDAPTDATKQPLDATSALVSPTTVVSYEKGQKLQFNAPTNNERIAMVLETLMALWQCKCDTDLIPEVLGKSDVFQFVTDETGGITSMTITTKVGAKIIVKSPGRDLTSRLIDAFSVYCDSSRNLMQQGKEITVYPEGKITTPQD